jgi:hypothetical protein
MRVGDERNRLYVLRFIFNLFICVQADRGFARSRLCTDGDGTTNNLVWYSTGYIRNDTSKKGGDAPRATD